MDKGEMGVGTLILLISVLLVAAVTAATLIQNTQTLQVQAMASSSQTTRQINTRVMVFEAAAEDGTAALENFSIVIKLDASSSTMNLNDIVLFVDTKNTSTQYTWSASSTYNTSVYSTTYLETTPTTVNGVLSRGDLIELKFQTVRPISGIEDVRIRISPRYGLPTTITVSAPMPRTTQRVHLYP